MHLETGLCHQVGVARSREQGREFLCFWERREREENLFVASSFLPYPPTLHMQDVLGSGVCSCVVQHFSFWIQEIFVPCQHSRDPLSWNRAPVKNSAVNNKAGSSSRVT